MELEAEILQIEQLQVHLLSATVALLISTSRYAFVWFHSMESILESWRVRNIPSQLNSSIFDNPYGLTWPMS